MFLGLFLSLHLCFSHELVKSFSLTSYFEVTLFIIIVWVQKKKHMRKANLGYNYIHGESRALYWESEKPELYIQVHYQPEVNTISSQIQDLQ